MTSLRLLIVEDSENDAELLLRHLRSHGYEIVYRRVVNKDEMLDAIESEKWDLIISDYLMPDFSGLDALAIAKQASSDIPFIIVSGNIGEDIAAAAMVAGAHDYVMKDNLVRLLPAIERELKEAKLRQQRNQTRAVMDSLAQSTYGVTGEMFFHALTEEIAKALDVRHVHIGEFVGINNSMVQTLSVWHDNMCLDNFQHPVKELPCAITANGEVVLLQDLASSAYSRTTLPIDMDVHGYMSFPLQNTAGRVTGLIVALSDKAFEKTDFLEYVLQFSAARAAAEIERSRVESQLRNSEQYVRGILNNIQDVIYQAGTDGRIDYVSPSVSQLLGYRTEELMGTLLSDLYLDEGGREVFLQALSDGHGNVFNYEAALKHKDGSAVWVSTNAHYFYDVDTGEMAGVEGIARDITTRKLTEQALSESEELFSKAFHCSPAMISISELSEDFSGSQFIKINESFLQAIGYERGQVIGHSFSDIGLFSDDMQRDEIKQLLHEHGRINEIELPFRSRSGETHYGLGSIDLLEINATPCVLLVCMDITERKQANEELARYRGQLEEQVLVRTKDLTAVVADLESEIAERKKIEVALVDANYQAEQASLAKTDFLANMSHELRTPLNSIIGFSELLMIEPEDVIDAESREKLGYILDSAWHLLSLINDILDLSKIESGKLVFEPATVNIQNMVEATLIMLGDKARKKDVRLTSDIEPVITKIIADERKLKQILSNLVSNAIKFSNAHSDVRVSVSLASLDEFNSCCGPTGVAGSHMTQFMRFSVEDTGIGIIDEDIGKLFQPFVQVDSSLTRRYEGSGLGLHLSRQMVELHGGCIWVDSEPGKGSTFSFIVPCGPRD